MASGIMLGGFGKGLSDQDPIGYYTEQKNVQMQNEMKQQGMAQSQVAKNLEYAKQIITETVKAGKSASSAAKAIQPIIDSTAQLAENAKLPGGGARITAIGDGLLAMPTPQTVASPKDAPKPVKIDAEGNMGIWDPKQNAFVPIPVAKQAAEVASAKSRAAPGSPNERVAQVFSSLTDEGPDAPQVSTVQPIGGYTADAIEFRAQQGAAGNSEEAFKGLGRNKTALAIRAAITNRMTEILKSQGADAATASARSQRFAAVTAGGKVLSKRQATIFGGIAVVMATAPIVAEISSKIDRTKYPLINQIILAGKEQSGDPDVVRLGIALNTLTNAYARAQGGGNAQLTDSARHEAEALLQRSYTDGQLKAGIDQLMVELQREKSKVGDALDEYLKLKKPEAVQQHAPANGGWSVEVEKP